MNKQLMQLVLKNLENLQPQTLETEAAPCPQHNAAALWEY